MGTKTNLRLVSQTSFSEKIPPLRKKNADIRSREYLAEHEVEKVRKAARSVGRHGLRDDTLILLMFRHALRVSEVAALKWEQIDLTSGVMHVQRRKNGIPATHPLRSIELRALRQIARDYPDSRYVFANERKAPLSNRGIHNIIARAGEQARMPFSVHPHMLRHSTGYHLANAGQDTRAIQAYMGHRNINNTVIYTQLSATRFEGFFGD